MGQSNYASGCTFQNALAKARCDANAYQGVSVSLDLGWLLDAGIVSEREDNRRKWEGAQDIAGIRAADLIAVLDHFCDPARRPTSASLCSSPSQLLVGAVTPADLTQHDQAIPPSMSVPFLDAFRTIPGRSIADGNSSKSKPQVQNPRARFRAAKSFGDKCDAVMDALREKLARALDIDTNDVDLGKAVSSYGVDSLMAVELRNWMRKDYDVEIAVFDILGGTTIIALSRQVVSRAQELTKGHDERGKE